MLISYLVVNLNKQFLFWGVSLDPLSSFGTFDSPSFMNLFHHMAPVESLFPVFPSVFLSILSFAAITLKLMYLQFLLFSLYTF